MLKIALAVGLAASNPQQLTDEQLRNEFLACDKESRQFMLDDASAGYCSTIYEQLKNRVFKGDSRAMLDWWREATTPQKQ